MVLEGSDWKSGHHDRLSIRILDRGVPGDGMVHLLLLLGLRVQDAHGFITVAAKKGQNHQKLKAKLFLK